ncbi:30S ribosomal protein S20 [Mycoplasmopsis cynos]|nr:30S ribosomal protein S20 [Mycoplasmopsis cynos]WAM11484.1 30S ribosomal protein S20 [Mycoplasmopsis cynos]
MKSKVKSIVKMEQARQKMLLWNHVLKQQFVKQERLVLAKSENANSLIAQAHKIIAKAVSKGVFHTNKGARKHSRLDMFVNKAK